MVFLKGHKHSKESIEKMRKVWEGRKNPVSNKHIFYRLWANTKTRCTNPNNPRYKDYGGRGIKVCNRWHDFQNFYDDMFEDYQKHIEDYGIKNTSIDRIDNNGNYEPSNCKWATWEEQTKNKRENSLSEEKRMRDIANKLLKEQKIKEKQDWFDSIKINTKLSRRDNIIKMRNEGLSYKQIGEKFGISRQRICQIINIYI